mmetsp:Transcript_10158/g.29615  ORF Transcript_10158/g.29615 Transcript_10158/m.29615 type:complete len:100 (+) Transcript_10158:653-952(+)|eukprot:scaffold117898_cov35-Tisochrysis_lutea.AAC.2
MASRQKSVRLCNPALCLPWSIPCALWLEGVARQGLEASRRVLQQMGRRAATNKLVLRGIAAAVILLFLFVMWPASQVVQAVPPPPPPTSTLANKAAHLR